MEPFIGQVIMFGGTFAPRGWALCDGQLLAISQNEALFSILGTTYGGDGRTTFGLPDLRGRAALHEGSGPGLSTRRLGQKGGAQAVTLNTNTMPSHNHGATASGTVMVTEEDGTTNEVAGNSLANSTSGNVYTADAANATLHADTLNVNVNLAPNGGSSSHNNMPPFQCVHFIIALIGTYPSRS